jgi:Skp family chaperone for outer membrane proteins
MGKASLDLLASAWHSEIVSTALQRQTFDEERHAKAAEISQLHGRLAELRHQLETTQIKAGQDGRKHDEELAQTNAMVNELKLQNAEVEVCPSNLTRPHMQTYCYSPCKLNM